MKGRSIKIAVIFLALVVGAVTPVLAFEPATVTCIAPANPGGGWDFTCRSGGQLLYDLKFAPKPVRVVNMPGGGGGVAYAHIVTEQKGPTGPTTGSSPLEQTLPGRPSRTWSMPGGQIPARLPWAVEAR
jgi:putative tricarboxylic transport membrane protein